MVSIYVRGLRSTGFPPLLAPFGQKKQREREGIAEALDLKGKEVIRILDARELNT